MNNNLCLKKDVIKKNQMNRKSKMRIINILEVIVVHIFKFFINFL